MMALPALELRTPSPPPTLLDAVRTFNREHADDALGIPLEKVAGQQYLDGMVARTWPTINQLADTIRSIIAAGPGAVVVRNLGFEDYEPDTQASLLLALTSAIGMPTDHAKDRRVLWPIIERAPRPGRVRTFSERTGEAPFHTDSAFAPEPELYNGLYVVRRAGCGGGLSRLISAASVIDRVAASPDGARCIDLLHSLRFPFQIPEAFYRDGPRVITAPILAHRPMIRFRPDAIQNGFEAMPELATPDHRWAFRKIWEAIETHPDVLEYMLDDGEFIVFDNHRLLHARGDYSDPTRHLVRIRMAERLRVAQSAEHRAPALVQ
jgi:alpha-ketoglutarate-dependent taurine dioxygenase